MHNHSMYSSSLSGETKAVAQSQYDLSCRWYARHKQTTTGSQCPRRNPYYIKVFVSTPGRRQSKTPILSRNVDQKSIETVFSIAICRHTGDKWESKTLFLSIFDPRSSIVDNVFDCRLPGVVSVYFPKILQK